LENFLKILFRSKHRKYKRYRVRGGLTVVLDPEYPNGDEILDIGKGGLTFNYVDRGDPLDEESKIDIYVDNELYLEKLKVKLVSNIEVGDISFSSKNIRRISVQFLSLTPVQEFDLKALIKSHGIE
jgi:hypothetical protein